MSDNLASEKDPAAQRLILAHDPLRPRYHFLPPTNWINDPHGLFEWNGAYHQFYQYNPHGPFHGTIHWGHAVSNDLLHWRDLPIALTPGPESYDQDGCWTGYLVQDDGRPTILYTATYPQTIAAAVSDDRDLAIWRKSDRNPIIPGPPDEIGRLSGGHFRDPFVWQTGHGWEMLVVSKIEGRGGRVLLYSSPDLYDWTYRGVFLAGDVDVQEPYWQGTMWECPNLIDFGDTQGLIVSVQATPNEHLYAIYFTGQRQGDRFQPRYSELLVHGGTFYAPQVSRLADGRLLMFGWLPESRTQQASMEAGWNGAHSLPLEVELLAGGALAVKPAREVKSLRQNHWQKPQSTLAAGDHAVLNGIEGGGLEIALTLRPDQEAVGGLEFLRSPDGQEVTRLTYNGRTAQLAVERENASLDQRADINAATMPVSLGEGEALNCRIFVDQSIVEVFVNGRHCLVTRVYPTRDDSRQLALFCTQGQLLVESLDIWHMEAVWPVS